MHVFIGRYKYVLLLALSAPSSVMAQPLSTPRTACEVEGDLRREGLASSNPSHTRRYKREVDAWWGHSTSGPPRTVEALEAWIAENPDNLCLADARWLLQARKDEQALATAREAAEANARAEARAARLASLRAKPTAGAMEAKFARALDISGGDVPASSPGGTVGYELEIDEVGAVTACRVISNASADLDRITCILLRKRARFDPARDEMGMPIASRYRNKISWPRSE